MLEWTWRSYLDVRRTARVAGPGSRCRNPLPRVFDYLDICVLDILEVRGAQRVQRLEPGLVWDLVHSACCSMRILYWTKVGCAILCSNDSSVGRRCAAAIYHLRQSHPHVGTFGIELKPVFRRTAAQRLPPSFMVYLTGYFPTFLRTHCGYSVTHRASPSPQKCPPNPPASNRHSPAKRMAFGDDANQDRTRIPKELRKSNLKDNLRD